MLKKLSMMVLAVGMSLLAAPVVRNGFFSEGAQNNGLVPDGWSVSEGSTAWEFVDYDGVGDAASVMFKARANAGVMQQKVALEANSDYSLVFWYKNTGVTPSVVLYDAAQAQAGKELAQFKAQAGKDLGWTYARVDFRSTASKEYLLALTGDVDGKENGTAGFDGIEIITRAEADKRPVPNAAPAKSDNIALHKKYTLLSRPDYHYCTDPDDIIQLTDGVKTEGYFWTQKTTVGWHMTRPGMIVVDLEKQEPICGASWSCAAASHAGVKWPVSIMVLVSDDQETWNLLGELTHMSAKHTPPPSPEGYHTFTYATREMKGYGRYVAFIGSSPDASAIFCDEIEIYRGDESCKTAPDYKVTRKCSLSDFHKSVAMSLNVVKVIDLQNVVLMGKIKELPDGFAGKAEALALAEKNVAEITDLGFSMPEICRTELPFVGFPLSASIYKLNAYVQQSMGYRKPFAWKSDRWANMTFIDNAPKESLSPKLSVMMMRGEVRADAFSIANPTLEDMEVAIEAKGFPKDLNVQFKRVAVSVTSGCYIIGSALLPIDGKVTVPAGCNVQIWTECYKPDAKPGIYNGKISISGAFKQSVPMAVEIVKLPAFPKDPKLNVGGWEYSGTYNKDNVLEQIAFMREIGVNSTWNRTEVMPMNPKFDAEGKLVNLAELNFNNFDEWISRWPGAHFYCIAHFMPREQFFGEKANTPRYVRMVGEYYKALEGHMTVLGLKPEQLVYLYHDEPMTLDGDKIVIDFMKAIRTVDLKMQFFQDPIWTEPWKGIPEAFSMPDILCPNTPMMTQQGDKFKEFYNKQREDGRTLWLYSCSGPAKDMDPLDYWRGQAWQCQLMKAQASFFWAMGDSGGSGDSWAAFSMPGSEFGPYFSNPKGAPDDAKQAEGIRESIADYEYMKLLEAEIARVKAANPTHPALAEAEKTLAEAPAEVVASIKMSTMKWIEDKDRNLMDRNAQRILKALEKLAAVK